MKLINKTKLDDAKVYNLINVLGKAVKGVRVSNVIVIITTGQNHLKGVASRMSYYFHKKEVISTDGGCIQITIPLGTSYYYLNNHLDQLMNSMCNIILHEWGHIKDFQKKTYKRYKKNSKWKDRPCEQYAEEVVEETLKRIPLDTFSKEILDFKNEYIKYVETKFSDTIVYVREVERKRKTIKYKITISILKLIRKFKLIK